MPEQGPLASMLPLMVLNVLSVAVPENVIFAPAVPMKEKATVLPVTEPLTLVAAPGISQKLALLSPWAVPERAKVLAFSERFAVTPIGEPKIMNTPL